MAGLDRYLASMAGVPFAYGSCDCVKFVCGWVVENGHADPSEKFGTYDESGAEDILSSFNGLADLATHGLGFLTRTAEPRRGAVGVLRLNGLARPVMGICTGAKWAMKAGQGVMVRPATCLKAWAV